MSASSTKALPGPATGPHARTGLYVRGGNGIKLRDLKVRRLLRKLRGACPWIEPSDMPLARRWCELEVLCSIAYAALRDEGPMNEKGDGRRLLDDYRKLALAQASIGRELGLSPAARQALKASRDNGAFDLAAQIVEDGAADGAIAVSELRKRAASESKANNASDGGEDGTGA